MNAIRGFAVANATKSIAAATGAESARRRKSMDGKKGSRLRRRGSAGGMSRYPSSASGPSERGDDSDSDSASRSRSRVGSSVADPLLAAKDRQLTGVRDRRLANLSQRDMAFSARNLRQVFRLLDSDNSHEVSAAEIQQGLVALGFDACRDPTVLNRLLLEVDEDLTGSISEGEFVSYFSRFTREALAARLQTYASHRVSVRATVYDECGELAAAQHQLHTARGGSVPSTAGAAGSGSVLGGASDGGGAFATATGATTASRLKSATSAAGCPGACVLSLNPARMPEALEALCATFNIPRPGAAHEAAPAAEADAASAASAAGGASAAGTPTARSRGPATARGRSPRPHPSARGGSGGPPASAGGLSGLIGLSSAGTMSPGLRAAGGVAGGSALAVDPPRPPKVWLDVVGYSPAAFAELCAFFQLQADVVTDSLVFQAPKLDLSAGLPQPEQDAYAAEAAAAGAEVVTDHAADWHVGGAPGGKATQPAAALAPQNGGGSSSARLADGVAGIGSSFSNEGDGGEAVLYDPNASSRLLKGAAAGAAGMGGVHGAAGVGIGGPGDGGSSLQGVRALLLLHCMQITNSAVVPLVTWWQWWGRLFAWCAAVLLCRPCRQKQRGCCGRGHGGGAAHPQSCWARMCSCVGRCSPRGGAGYRVAPGGAYTPTSPSNASHTAGSSTGAGAHSDPHAAAGGSGSDEWDGGGWDDVTGGVAGMAAPAPAEGDDEGPRQLRLVSRKAISANPPEIAMQQMGVVAVNEHFILTFRGSALEGTDDASGMGGAGGGIGDSTGAADPEWAQPPAEQKRASSVAGPTRSTASGAACSATGVAATSADEGLELASAQPLSASLTPPGSASPASQPAGSGSTPRGAPATAGSAATSAAASAAGLARSGFERGLRTLVRQRNAGPLSDVLQLLLPAVPARPSKLPLSSGGKINGGAAAAAAAAASVSSPFVDAGNVGRIFAELRFRLLRGRRDVAHLQQGAAKALAVELVDACLQHNFGIRDTLIDWEEALIGDIKTAPAPGHTPHLLALERLADMYTRALLPLRDALHPGNWAGAGEEGDGGGGAGDTDLLLLQEEQQQALAGGEGDGSAVPGAAAGIGPAAGSASLPADGGGAFAVEGASGPPLFIAVAGARNAGTASAGLSSAPSIADRAARRSVSSGAPPSSSRGLLSPSQQSGTAAAAGSSGTDAAGRTHSPVQRRSSSPLARQAMRATSSRIAEDATQRSAAASDTASGAVSPVHAADNGFSPTVDSSPPLDSRSSPLASDAHAPLLPGQAAPFAADPGSPLASVQPLAGPLQHVAERRASSSGSSSIQQQQRRSSFSGEMTTVTAFPAGGSGGVNGVGIAAGVPASLGAGGRRPSYISPSGGGTPLASPGQGGFRQGLPPTQQPLQARPSFSPGAAPFARQPSSHSTTGGGGGGVLGAASSRTTTLPHAQGYGPRHGGGGPGVTSSRTLTGGSNPLASGAAGRAAQALLAPSGRERSGSNAYTVGGQGSGVYADRPGSAAAPGQGSLIRGDNAGKGSFAAASPGLGGAPGGQQSPVPGITLAGVAEPPPPPRVPLQPPTATLFFAAQLLEFQELAEDIGAIVSDVSRTKESIPQHRSTLNLVQSDQMNRVLFFLTLITATSVPVTFLTGLWGMNFVDMHELDPATQDDGTLPIAGYKLFWITVSCTLSAVVIAFWRAGFFRNLG